MSDDWFRWIIGGAGTLLVAWTGIVQSQIASVKRDARQEARDLWAELNRHKADYQQFRGDMLERVATKEDLQRTEDRILAALQFARGHSD